MFILTNSIQFNFACMVHKKFTFHLLFMAASAGKLPDTTQALSLEEFERNIIANYETAKDKSQAIHN